MAIVVCRTKELAVQNFNTLKLLAPHISAGFFCAGLKHKDTFRHGFSVLFATAQSIFKREALIALADETIIDEGDQADERDTKQYKAIIKSSETYWGRTATPYRLVAGGPSLLPVRLHIHIDCQRHLAKVTGGADTPSFLSFGKHRAIVADP